MSIRKHATPPTPTPTQEWRAPITFIAVGLPQGGDVAPEPLAGRVRVDGRFWVNDAGTYRPRYLSGFKLPALACQDPDRVQHYLDLAVTLGFNGVRTMAGALTWGPQSPVEACDGLPMVLQEAAARNLSLEVTILTDSGTGYDCRAQVDDIGMICDLADNAICEVANEPYHGSQCDAVHDYANLAQWGAASLGARHLAWAEGAPETDEPSPEAGYHFDGPYITLHLDRGRDEWNMVRRVRELENVSNTYDRPVMNNEPIGWAEVAEPGRRCANPAIAFTMGALSRGFEVGLVSHADHGLECDDPGPVQTQCHQAAVRGFRVYGVDTRLRFENAGWATSPIETARFEDTIVRAYSFMDGGDHGWSVLLGLTGDPGVRWQNGFAPVRCVDEMVGVQVWEIAR